MKNIILIVTILLLKLNFLIAQEDIPFKSFSISYKEYFDLVKTHNLQYAAEKLNINISEAAIEAARLFQDPYFSIDLTQDMEGGTKIDNGFSSELSKTIDLGGERKARIDLTRSEKELTGALVADYFRNLQAEATLFYIEAMKHRQLYLVRYNSYMTMKKLAEADSIRYKLGSIMEIDAIQSSLETGILKNDLINAISEWKNSLLDISVLAGTSKKDSLFLPSSYLQDVVRDFVLTNLITEALNKRADLQAAMYNKDVSKKALLLTRKMRNTDIDLKIGYSGYYMSDDVSPNGTAFTAGIGIPLKFSNFNKGELAIAEFKVQQAEELFKHAELQISAEVIQAYEMYQNYSKQVQNYNDGLLENAENVRKGKIYSYQRGESSLLEVLNAQRTFNEIQTTYYETRFNQAAALIELEKVAGIWDIDF